MFLRWFPAVVLLVCLAISGFFRQRARKESGTLARKAEPVGLIALRITVTLPLFVGLVLTLVVPQWMAWALLPLPMGLRWAGAALGALMIPATYWVFTSIGANISETVLTKEDHQLVTRGPYRWVRHPLYTTGLALLLSIGLMTASGFVLFFTLIVGVLVVTVVIPREEAALVHKFGDAYRKYQDETSRILPGL